MVGNLWLVGEQTISIHANIPASTITLHTPAPFPHLYWKKGEHKHKDVLIGYWGKLWKKNYTVWIALELWPNVCPSMPLTCIKINELQMSQRKPPTSQYDLCFLPVWGRARKLYIGYITDLPVMTYLEYSRKVTIKIIPTT